MKKQIPDCVIERALREILEKKTTAYRFSREQGVHPEALSSRLRRIPEYIEFREAEKQRKNALREEALALGQQGFTPAAISKKLEIKEGTARDWLQQAGIDTSVSVDTSIICTVCNGTMEKKDLFFFICESCKSEFWPPEESLPEDPDSWRLPGRITFEKGDTALVMIRNLKTAGKLAPDIAAALNAAGIKTARGRDWTAENVRDYSKRYDIGTEQARENRELVLKICRQMAGRVGVNCNDIAERLNALGLKTNRQQKWTEASVQKVIRNSLKIEVKLRNTKSLTVKRAVSGVGQTGVNHVWRWGFSK